MEVPRFQLIGQGLLKDRAFRVLVVGAVVVITVCVVALLMGSMGVVLFLEYVGIIAGITGAIAFRLIMASRRTIALTDEALVLCGWLSRTRVPWQDIRGIESSPVAEGSSNPDEGSVVVCLKRRLKYNWLFPGVASTRGLGYPGRTILRLRVANAHQFVAIANKYKKQIPPP